jgi:TonB family protein
MRAFITLLVFVVLALCLSACSTSKPFMPQSQYPTDPWVKGYSDPDDCLGGEKLAAIDFALPDYPSRAYRTGRQGWVIIRLDVNDEGATENVRVERSVPDGLFDGTSEKAVNAWTFQAPIDGALKNCRVLLRYRAGKVTLGG